MRYASSAVAVVPSERSTFEPARPLNVGPVPFEPLLEWLSKAEIEKLSVKHDLKPRWPEPWIKARTGGSDDHGLLNVGRTWTEFAPGTQTRQQLTAEERALQELLRQPRGQ